MMTMMIIMLLVVYTVCIQNVEKVWIAEQQEGKEKKRLAELQKQLIEERQILELRQLQAANGGQVNKIIDNSLDWMYEGPSTAMKAQQQLSSEEYLLGKIYNGKDVSSSSSISNASFMTGKTAVFITVTNYCLFPSPLHYSNSPDDLSSSPLSSS